MDAGNREQRLIQAQQQFCYLRDKWIAVRDNNFIKGTGAHRDCLQYIDELENLIEEIFA